MRPEVAETEDVVRIITKIVLTVCVPGVVPSVSPACAGCGQTRRPLTMVILEIREPLAHAYSTRPTQPNSAVGMQGNSLSTLFEGFKAYKGRDQQVCLFRPWLNTERLLRSLRRLCLPVSGQSALEGERDFDKQELLECIRRLIEVDKDWVPDGHGSSLCVRPVLIGNEGAGAGPLAGNLWLRHRLSDLPSASNPVRRQGERKLPRLTGEKGREPHPHSSFSSETPHSHHGEMARAYPALPEQAEGYSVRSQDPQLEVSCVTLPAVPSRIGSADTHEKCHKKSPPSPLSLPGPLLPQQGEPPLSAGDISFPARSHTPLSRIDVRSPLIGDPKDRLSPNLLQSWRRTATQESPAIETRI
ncbi:hypothetical protein ACRRTK_024734 [Alexandromys fortis]